MQDKRWVKYYVESTRRKWKYKNYCVYLVKYSFKKINFKVSVRDIINVSEVFWHSFSKNIKSHKKRKKLDSLIILFAGVKYDHVYEANKKWSCESLGKQRKTRTYMSLGCNKTLQWYFDLSTSSTHSLIVLIKLFNNCNKIITMKFLRQKYWNQFF